MDLKPIWNKHNSNWRIMIGEYKTCCRGHKGNFICDKDGFEISLKTEKEAIRWIKEFKEYMEKKNHPL